MSWHNIKRSMADVYFSRYLRLTRKVCAYCGRKGEGVEGITGLQASHFYSRRMESVRFDEQNVDILCIGCHRRLGTEHRQEYEVWKKGALGEKGFDLLQVRANTYQKRDRKLFELYYKEQLRKLNETN